MTNATRVSLLLAVLLTVSSTIAGPAPHFRGSNWYDSIEKVRATETATFVEHRTQEMNVAVSPAAPWKVEHLYYKDVLLDLSVLVLYRFDLECRMLYQADYIFPRVLEEQDILKLVAAIEEKCKTKLETQYLGGDLFSSGNVNESTAVHISQPGLLHFHAKNTTISYHTTNWNWIGGWVAGTEPTCQDKKERHEQLKEKL